MLDWLKKHFCMTQDNTVGIRAKTPSVESTAMAHVMSQIKETLGQDALDIYSGKKGGTVMPPEEPVGEPASLLIWSLENEPERWEIGESVCLGDYTLLDKNTGRSYTADFYGKKYRCNWMTHHERLEVGKAIVKRCKQLCADANAKYVNEEKEQMFKDFGRNT